MANSKDNRRALAHKGWLHKSALVEGLVSYWAQKHNVPSATELHELIVDTGVCHAEYPEETLEEYEGKERYLECSARYYRPRFR